MFYYTLYELTIATDIEFPQLVPTTGRNADIVIESGDIPEAITSITDKQYEFGDTLSWLLNSTCYLVIENGNHITYSFFAGGNISYLRSYILGWGISMLALQRGELAMHGSLIADSEGAILISGESGCGKSTVTQALLEEGYSFMADDITIAKAMPDGTVVAAPAFPYQKLCRDAVMRGSYDMNELIYIDEEKDKFLVPYKGTLIEHAMPVKAMIILYRHKGDDVCVNEVTGLNKLHACLSNLFLRRLLREKKYDPAIGSLGLKLASGLNIYTVGRPDGRYTLNEVITAVKSIIS